MPRRRVRWGICSYGRGGQQMSNSADRLSGAFFLLFGLAMVFLVVPQYVEDAQGGNLSAKTTPIIVAWIKTACGGALVIKPTTHWAPDGCFFVLALGVVSFRDGAADPVQLQFEIVWQVFQNAQAGGQLFMVGTESPEKCGS